MPPSRATAGRAPGRRAPAGRAPAPASDMRRVLGWILALAATGAAVFGRVLLNPLLGERLPFVTLFAAVALAVWIGGFAPAVAAAILGYLAMHQLVRSVGPGWSLSPDTPAGLAGVAAYALTCLVIIALGSGMRRARARAEEAVSQVRNQKLALEYEIAGHRRTEQALRHSEA